MQICLYLTPELIITPLTATTKDGVIRELAEHLVAEKHIPNGDHILEAILEREASSSTFLPSGIAIPHARLGEISDIMITMGVSRTPIKDNGDADALNANLFCLFLSPMVDKEFGRHLKLLARISAVFNDPDFIAQLTTLATPRDVFEAIQKRERNLDES
jgi:nitrogen PTS system EIIA component